MLLAARHGQPHRDREMVTGAALAQRDLFVRAAEGLRGPHGLDDPTLLVLLQADHPRVDVNRGGVGRAPPALVVEQARRDDDLVEDKDLPAVVVRPLRAAPPGLLPELAEQVEQFVLWAP